MDVSISQKWDRGSRTMIRITGSLRAEFRRMNMERERQIEDYCYDFLDPLIPKAHLAQHPLKPRFASERLEPWVQVCVNQKTRMLLVRFLEPI